LWSCEGALSVALAQKAEFGAWGALRACRESLVRGLHRSASLAMRRTSKGERAVPAAPVPMPRLPW
ncbi:hypothetical protein CSC81_18950, partial [Tenacibaculum discolor]